MEEWVLGAYQTATCGDGHGNGHGSSGRGQGLPVNKKWRNEGREEWEEKVRKTKVGV